MLPSEGDLRQRAMQQNTRAHAGGLNGQQGFRPPVDAGGRKGQQGFRPPVDAGGLNGQQGFRPPVDAVGLNWQQGFRPPVDAGGLNGQQGFRPPVDAGGLNGQQGFRPPVDAGGLNGQQGFRPPVDAGGLNGQQGFRPPVDAERNRAPIPHRPYVIRPQCPDMYGLTGAGAHLAPYIAYCNEQPVPVVENPAYHVGNSQALLLPECYLCRCDNSCCMPVVVYDHRPRQRYERLGYLDYPMCARSDVPPPMYYGYAVANPPPPYGWVYPQNCHASVAANGLNNVPYANSGHVFVAANGLNNAPYANSAAGGSVMQNRLPYTAPSGTFTGNADCVYYNTPLINGFQQLATNAAGLNYGVVANYP